MGVGGTATDGDSGGTAGAGATLSGGGAYDGGRSTSPTSDQKLNPMKAGTDAVIRMPSAGVKQLAYRPGGAHT